MKVPFVGLVVLLVAFNPAAGQPPPPPEPETPESTEAPSAQDEAKQAAAEPRTLSASAETALTAAKAAFKAGQWQSALDAALQVLGDQPKHRDALYIAGASERRLNLLDAAEAHLQTLVDEDPRYPFAHHRLGYVEFVQAEALARGGDAAAAKAKYSDSADAFGEELRRDPKQLSSASSQAIALARAGRIEESIKAHEFWIALAPEMNDPVVSLAATCALAGRTTEAMASLDRLPHKDPKSTADAAMTVATVFSEMQTWGAAVPFLEKAVAADPSATHARAVMTAAYARALQYDDAAKSLETLLAMDPSPDDAALAGEAIKATIGDGKSSRSIPGVEPPAALRVPAPRYPTGQDRSVQTEILVLTRVAPPHDVVATIMVPNRIWKSMRTSGFEDAAFDAVKRGRFESGTKNGRPAELWTVVPVMFAGR